MDLKKELVSSFDELDIKEDVKRTMPEAALFSTNIEGKVTVNADDYIYITSGKVTCSYSHNPDGRICVSEYVASRKGKVTIEGVRQQTVSNGELLSSEPMNLSITFTDSLQHVMFVNQLMNLQYNVTSL